MRPSSVTAVCARRRLDGQLSTLQPVGCGDAEQAKPVGQDYPCCVSEPEPGTPEVIDGRVVTGQDAAGIVEAVVRAGQLFQVSRDPMRLTELCRAGDHAREVCERLEQVVLSLVGQ